MKINFCVDEHILFRGCTLIIKISRVIYFLSILTADNKWYHRNMKAETLEEQKHVFYRVLAVKDGRGIQQSGVISQGNILLNKAF